MPPLAGQRLRVADFIAKRTPFPLPTAPTDDLFDASVRRYCCLGTRFFSARSRVRLSKFAASRRCSVSPMLCPVASLVQLFLLRAPVPDAFHGALSCPRWFFSTNSFVNPASARAEVPLFSRSCSPPTALPSSHFGTFVEAEPRALSSPRSGPLLRFGTKRPSAHPLPTFRSRFVHASRSRRPLELCLFSPPKEKAVIGERTLWGRLRPGTFDSIPPFILEYFSSSAIYWASFAWFQRSENIPRLDSLRSLSRFALRSSPASHLRPKRSSICGKGESSSPLLSCLGDGNRRAVLLVLHSSRGRIQYGWTAPLVAFFATPARPRLIAAKDSPIDFLTAGDLYRFPSMPVSTRSSRRPPFFAGLVS